MPRRKKMSPRQVALKYGFRSGFEKDFSENLTENNITFDYELEQIEYTKPESKHKYTPDFVIEKKDGSKMYVETKGRLVVEDRKKLKLIKSQFPDMDIRLLFQNGSAKLRKGAKTTYGEWASKEGFKWATGKVLPREWLKEIK